MSDNLERRMWHGYVYGCGQNWAAICLDLDIVAQGHSQEEAISILREMVRSYVEHARTLPPEECHKMLTRRAPWLTRLAYYVRFLTAKLLRRNERDDKTHYIRHSDGEGMACA